MTRKEALDILSVPPLSDEVIKNEFYYVATKLGISEDDLKKHMNAENKSYKDYSNQQYVYELGTKILKYFGVEKDVRR